MSQEEPAGPDSCGTGSWSSVRSFSFSNPHSGCCHFYDAKSCTSPSPVPSTIVWRQTPSNEHEKKKGDLSIAPPVNLLEEFLTFAACSGRIISIWNVCTTFEGATKSRSGWSTNPAALQPYNCKNFFTPIGFFFPLYPLLRPQQSHLKCISYDLTSSLRTKEFAKRPKFGKPPKRPIFLH